MTGPPLAYLRGEDAFGLERAVVAMAAELGAPDEPLLIWRTGLDDGEGADASAARRRERVLGEIESRIGMAPLFGGGTLVVVRQPEGFTREGAARERLARIAGAVPAGNGLAFVELLASGGRPPSSTQALWDAVKGRGGTVRDFPVPTRERMEAWIVARGSELGIRFAPGAARALAERIGAFVRESDVDRRRQTELADSELRKLALYRPDGTISRDDVAELVAEAIPGSTWAFLDAVGARRPREAVTLAERLLAEAAPPPLVIAQLHRRLRDLIVIRDHLDHGVRGGALVRELKMQPFRVQKLEEQASRWTVTSLRLALDGLLELDLASKGISLDGSTRQMSDGRTALALHTWLADSVAP